jgi:predicted ATPase/DNA-binding CsgD family transcriptional regulator
VSSQLTTFVGRDAELAAARGLLETVRLLTLVGPAGVGKTRIAQRLADEADFADGVVVIELDALTDPELLPQVAAVDLGLRDVPLEPTAQLLSFLRTKTMLIVLDNCEHLAQACREFVTAVLATAPQVRFLATSRHVLGIGGEQLLPIRPLSVPDRYAAARPDDAVALFAARAAFALPHFTVNDDNCETVLGICSRLDGIPLAIELVVPWLRVMSAHDVLTRLDDTFALLTAEAEARPSRQQTLIAAMDWSFALCAPDEQTLWARASVFTGGFTVEAAAAVCTDDRIPPTALLRLLGGLVDKSVLIRDEVDGVTRLRMLYTIRHYGRRLLAQSGDERQFRCRHLDHFRTVVDRIGQQWCGPDQVELLAQMRLEHNNLRAALDFGLGDPEQQFVGARLATAMYFYWLCGFLGESRRWLDRVLGLDSLPDEIRQDALWINSYAATALGELPAGKRFAEQAAVIAGRTGDPLQKANAMLITGGSAFLHGELVAGEQYYRRSAECYLVANVIDCRIVLAYASMAMVAATDGDLALAEARAADAIEIAEKRGERWANSYAHYAVALANWRVGRHAEAARHAMESLRLKADFNDLLGLAVLCETVAWIVTSACSAQQAAEALGVASMVWRHMGSELVVTSDNWRLPRSRCEEVTRGALGEERYRTAYARGTAIGANLDDAVDHLLKLSTAVATAACGNGPTVLTGRELEVAELVAAGAANKEIAARLVISTRTAEKHLANITKKLGFTSRSQLAAWVVDRRPS